MEPWVLTWVLWQMLSGHNTSTSWVCVQNSLQVISNPNVLTSLVSLDNLQCLFPSPIGHMGWDLYSIFILQILHNCGDWCANINSQHILTLVCHPFSCDLGILYYCWACVQKISLSYAKSTFICNNRSCIVERTFYISAHNYDAVIAVSVEVIVPILTYVKCLKCSPKLVHIKETKLST